MGEWQANGSDSDSEINRQLREAVKQKQGTNWKKDVSRLLNHSLFSVRYEGK